jgi:hypothetical protein
VWQDLVLGETICQTLSGFLAQNLERLVTEDAQALQPGVRGRGGVGRPKGGGHVYYSSSQFSFNLCRDLPLLVSIFLSDTHPHTHMSRPGSSSGWSAACSS